MLFEDQLREEDSLVQSRILADSVDVGRVEFGRACSLHLFYTTFYQL